MKNKTKNMNESEKILYALNVLQVNSKDEKNKKELMELMNALEIKMGKTVTEEQSEDTSKEEDK